MEKRRRSSRGAELRSVRSERAAEVQKSGEQVCLLLLLLLLLVDTREEKHDDTCATGVAGVDSGAVLLSGSTACSVQQ